MKHDDTIEEKVPPEGAEMGEQASEEQDQSKLYPVRLKDLEEPIQEDCSSDAIPYGTIDMEGKKKVLVPELISMTKVLFDNYRLPLYSYLIANTFGVPMEQYKKETEVKEMDGFVEIAMLTGVREKTGEADQQDNTEPAPTPPDPVTTDE